MAPLALMPLMGLVPPIRPPLPPLPFGIGSYGDLRHCTSQLVHLLVHLLISARLLGPASLLVLVLGLGGLSLTVAGGCPADMLLLPVLVGWRRKLHGRPSKTNKMDPDDGGWRLALS